MIRVLIADDETLLRAGIRMVLDNADDLEVVAEAADGADAVSACREQHIDVALLDVRMPRVDGLTALTEIARTAPDTRSLMLTTFGDDDNVAKALRGGARGYLLKDTAPADLIRAVQRATTTDELLLAPQITRRLIERHLTTPDSGGSAQQQIDVLSTTETEVLGLVGNGLSNAEIARRLHMGMGTVKAHVSRILTKLDCDNRVQAAILAHDAGLLTGETD